MARLLGDMEYKEYSLFNHSIYTYSNMKRFIAYFDFLGYKDFILNNDSNYLKVRAGHILRDIQISLGQGKYQDPMNGSVLADISLTRINCLNISDTVIFWTSDGIKCSKIYYIIYHIFS